MRSTTRRTVALAAVGLVLLLAGCSVPVADGTDELGRVDGTDHDDTLAVDESDGFDREELDAVARRAMARIEVERGKNFRRSVPVRIVSRAEFRERDQNFVREQGEFDEQVWRAAFLVGDDADVDEEFDALYGSSVQGYYTSGDGGQIVIVTDDPEAASLDRGTLVHELVHALQDQQFGLGRQTETRDELLAWQGVFEGEANYLMYRYDERCEDDWECVRGQIESGDGSGEIDPNAEAFNPGLFLSIYVPYAEGPEFVHALRRRGGWEAVDAAYDDPPESTAEIIHPERYPDDPPRDVTLDDRSGDGWSRLDGGRTETLGEARLYAAFWSNGVVDRSHPTDDTDRYGVYNYSHPLTDGWDGDAVAPYRSDDGAYGHVLRTAWESEADAREFREGYRRLLERRGAERVERAEGAGTFRIPEDDPFAGAYRVTRRGDAVTVVRAPTVADLADVHAPRPSGESADAAAAGTSSAARTLATG